MIIPDSLKQNNPTIRDQVAKLVKAARQQPPDSITGAACTSSSSNRVLIDWLAFTDHSGLSLDDLVPGFTKLGPVELDFGINRYHHAWRAGNVGIYDRGTPEMGQHVVITGAGCRELEAAGVISEESCGGWLGYLQLLLDSGVSFTRIDAAIDDFTDSTTLADLKACLDADYGVSRWRDYTPHGRRSFTGARRSDGLSFGTRNSPLYARIYDKALETLVKTRKPGAHEHHTRFELEFHHKKATAFVAKLVEQEPIGDLVRGIWADYVQFKTPTGADSNKRRWALLPAWSAWLDGVSALHLAVAPAARTMETLLNWLDKACSPSLALVVKWKGGDLSALDRFAYAGAPRITARHLLLLPPDPFPDFAAS